MGHYLKQQYEERDLARTLAKVHGVIDEETKKLCDEIKNLKLSHNRMRKLLKVALDYIESLGFVESDNGNSEYLHKRITIELYGLENYKGLKGGV